MAFIPGLTLSETALTIALFTAIYTTAGRLRAVVYTDVMQAEMLLVGSAVLAWTVFGQFGCSWARVAAQVPAGHLSLIRPMNDPG